MRTAAIAVLVLLAVAPAGNAHVVSDREVLMLRDLTPGLIVSLTRAPDSLGHVAPNRAGSWQHVEHQEPGLLRLADACARGDSASAEACWPVIERAMVAQRPAGDYESTPGANDLERTEWWIAELCRAEIAVMNSPLQNRFRFRVSLLLPKLRRSVDWVATMGDDVARRHAGRCERSLVDAQLFLLADGIFHEPRLAELGQRALDAALKGQRADGAFASSGRDLAAEARALTALTAIATYFPMPMLDRASEKSAGWLRARLRSRRDADSESAWRESVLALAFHAARVRDRGLAEHVKRLAVANGTVLTSR